MFKKLEPLENSKHQELRLSKNQNFGFAYRTNAVQLSFSEISQASQYYPIVFPADGSCIPTAIMGITENKNAYVDPKGQWKVPYVPFSVRMYPFVLVPIDGQEDKLALCIDSDAEHFAGGMGDPMFTADGEPNEFVQGVLNSLQAYHKELATTQALFTGLAEKELIVDRIIELSINNEPKRIDGFKGINMEKLMTMDDAFIAGLVKNGSLPLVYSHLQSFSKFSFLYSADSNKPA
ncbi:MAG: SapC family protein [Proteobacteria bacterium]|nr:SapC family protein [Desulfobacula sp.]MBU4132597.1 SapC family protein [Pseudomonadota bacterium]